MLTAYPRNREHAPTPRHADTAARTQLAQRTPRRATEKEEYPHGRANPTQTAHARHPPAKTRRADNTRCRCTGAPWKWWRDTPHITARGLCWVHASRGRYMYAHSCIPLRALLSTLNQKPSRQLRLEGKGAPLTLTCTLLVYQISNIKLRTCTSPPT